MSATAALPGGSPHRSLSHLHFDWMCNGFKPYLNACNHMFKSKRVSKEGACRLEVSVSPIWLIKNIKLIFHVFFFLDTCFFAFSCLGDDMFEHSLNCHVEDKM